MTDSPASNQFILHDYNGLLADGALTNPSAGERQGKFMLVGYQGKIHLIMGSVSVFPYHADLLERFCRDNHILYDWTKRPTHLTIRDPQMRLNGGGWVQVEPKAKEVRFSGRSTAYGAFERSILEPILPQISVPEIITITIG